MGDTRITIETGVDQLVSYLKFHEPTNINDLAKALNTTPKIIESWAEFLIEEKIIGIEYRLTTPYLYLITDDKNKDINYFRKEFQGQDNSLNESMKEYNWKNYILQVIENHKTFFIREAKKRRLQNPEKLWEEYKNKVTNL